MNWRLFRAMIGVFIGMIFGNIIGSSSVEVAVERIFFQFAALATLALVLWLQDEIGNK